MKAKKSDGAKMRKAVREGYAKVAASGCGCGCASNGDAKAISGSVGYSEAEMASAPEGANMGLGCGNPTALASLRAGETVLDLGSGGGFDCFIAASRVGGKGMVIGVDMTPEMLDKARANAKKSGHSNVEFRLGEIENLPAADSSIDVVISNCVINLSPDKGRVFSEAYRVLRRGGRLMVSDMVLAGPLPPKVSRSVKAYVGCISGAVARDEYLGMMRRAGFSDVEVVKETRLPKGYFSDSEATKEAHKELRLSRREAEELSGAVLSISIRAVKK